LKEAQEARRALDRLVGYELSDIIWKKVRYGLSAGRVQSPALRILVEREKEIQAFVPEKYFELDGDFQTIGKIKESKTYKLNLSCDEVPKEENRTVEIKTRGENTMWKVDEVKQSDATRNPNAPFTTSTLQQAGSNRFGFSPKRTMQVAQKLYEKGLITYMRTDSTSLAASAVDEISTFVEKNYGKNYLEIRKYASKNKNAQEAHEAVRPTHIKDVNGGSTEEEQKLYNLIWARTVASQMSAAKMLRTKITAKCMDEHVPTFSINGSVLVFDGWLKADPASRGDETDLPKVMGGDEIKLEKINWVEKATQPPNRYSEAGLVKELEKRGIGRPATFASIISTIEDRGYVDKVNKALMPTTTGIVVSDFLTLHFQKYTSDDFTREMEDKLDEVANGNEKYADMLGEFYKPFHADVLSKQNIDKATNVNAAPEGIECPLCTGKMVEKLARNGTFYSCARFPDCIGARKIDGSIMEAPKDTGKVCPKCEKSNLVERDGKFGLFVACANYPKCKYIEKSEEEKNKNNTGVKCGHCADGFMDERKGRFGLFYSCNNYPDCKHIIKTKPTGNLCKICNELMMEGTKTIPERCSIKTCPMHRPDKI
jgi:DNA topoisomerase-1